MLLIHQILLFQFEDLEFQKKYETVIGHAERRELLEHKLKELKTSNGPHLTKLLSQCHCLDEMHQAEAIVRTPMNKQVFDTDRCQSVEEYASKIVVYKNQILLDNEDEPSEEIVKKGRKKKGSTTTTPQSTTSPPTTTTKGSQLQFSHLTKIRTLYIDEIIRLLDHHFPRRLLLDFDVFGKLM